MPAPAKTSHPSTCSPAIPYVIFLLLAILTGSLHLATILITTLFAYLALQTLSAEIEETHTADEAVDLSRKELKMAQDRFSAGVGDNIQVLNAQTALARALDDQVDAFARYDTARVNLAAAVGHMQEFK